MAMNRKEEELLQSAHHTPKISTLDIKALDAFIAWTVRAIEYWPMTPTAKKAVDALLVYRRQGTYAIKPDGATADGMLKWIDEASEGCPITSEVKVIIETFATYRVQLAVDQERLKQEAITYWQR